VCWCYGVVRLGWSGILMQAEAVLQHVSNVSTSILGECDLFVDLFHALYCSGLIEPEQYNTWNKPTTSRKLLKMDALTFETCWAVNSEIIKQVTSSWSIFIQLISLCCLSGTDVVILMLRSYIYCVVYYGASFKMYITRLVFYRKSNRSCIMALSTAM
jgi:hypothetical protein